MPVTIDLYRSRIGQFRSVRIKFKIQYKHNNFNEISKSRISSGMIRIVLLLSMVYLSKAMSIENPPPSLSRTQSGLTFRVTSTQPGYQEKVTPSRPKNHNFQARYKFGNRVRKKDGITIMHWNKGPSLLSNKLTDIEAVIDNFKPHVLGLSEANLRTHDDFTDVQLPDYNLHTCPTISNPAHGVSRVVVYTHKSITVKTRSDLMCPWISAVWLEVGLPGRHKFLLCNAYREWGYPNQQDKTSRSINAQKERWTMFLDKWEAGIREDKEIIVLGDLNICHNKWTQVDLPSTDLTSRLKPLRNELFDRIIPEGFCQLVRGPSFIKQGQDKSGLDHLYSNKVNKLSEVALHTNAGSDHKMIHVVRYSKTMSQNIRYVKKRVFKNFSEEGFKADVKLISWWPSVYGCENANEAAENLSKNLCEALDRWAPVKKIQVKPNYRPWISKETKSLMNQRDYAQELASRTNNFDDWRKFKNLRNTAVARNRAEKKAWEVRQLDHLANDSSNLWRNVKSWMGWRNSGPPSQLFVDKIIVKPKEIASTMNQFFVNKVKNLQKKLPRKKNDPLQYLKNAMKKRKCTFKLRPVTQDEVKGFVTKLKNSKSTGLDNLDTHTLKLVLEEILPAHTHY